MGRRWPCQRGPRRQGAGGQAGGGRRPARERPPRPGWCHLRLNRSVLRPGRGRGSGHSCPRPGRGRGDGRLGRGRLWLNGWPGRGRPFQFLVIHRRAGRAGPAGRGSSGRFVRRGLGDGTGGYWRWRWRGRLRWVGGRARPGQRPTGDSPGRRGARPGRRVRNRGRRGSGRGWRSGWRGPQPPAQLDGETAPQRLAARGGLVAGQPGTLAHVAKRGVGSGRWAAGCFG